MEIMPSIPHSLRGRGAARCVPIKCDCGDQFLWEHAAGRSVKCPGCRKTFEFPETEGAFDQTHNGQQI